MWNERTGNLSYLINIYIHPNAHTSPNTANFSWIASCNRSSASSSDSSACHKKSQN